MADDIEDLGTTSNLEGIHQSNIYDRQLFYDFLDGKVAKEHVIADRQRPNQREWEDLGVNSMDPRYACPNACRYCYTLTMDRRRGVTRQQTGAYHRNPKMVAKGWRPIKIARTALLFSVHDITDAVVPDFLTIAEKMLTAGYDILVVSKLRLSVAEALAPFLLKHRDHIEMRVTLGSCDPETTRYWEPGAPTPLERVQAMAHLLNAGVKVSISMEPLLGDDPIPFVRIISPYVESIWLGTMNHLETFTADPVHLERVETQKRHLLYLVEKLRDLPNVFWKRSIVMDIKLKRGLEAPDPEAVERETQRQHVIEILRQTFGEDGLAAMLAGQ